MRPRCLSERFDLVLDLRDASATPTFNQHALPQGYFRWDGQDLPTVLKLRELVGEFEKPKFFVYKQKLCAHSRNQTVGCNACVDICSAEAISSDKRGQRIVVNANLCVGCGACTTVCPTGALTYAYPRANDQGVKLKTLLSTYATAGGKDAVLLLHSQAQGQALVEELGRAAQLKVAQGVPANVIPVALWHTASLGLDVWLSAIAFGASQIVVLVTSEEAPQYLEGLQAQMDVAQGILRGLGYTGTHLQLLRATSATDLDAGLQALARTRQLIPGARARFAVAQEKRATLDLALDHLIEHAPLAGRRAARGPRAAGGRFAVWLGHGRQGQLHPVPELRQRLPGQRAAGQPATAPTALRREELRAVRPLRHHLPGERASRCSHACCSRRSARRRACSTNRRPTPACAAASPSARSRRSRRWWASWRATPCFRALPPIA